MLMRSSCQNVDKGVVDDAKVVLESPCRNPGEGVVDSAGVGDEAPSRKLGEGEVDDAKFDGQTPTRRIGEHIVILSMTPKLWARPDCQKGVEGCVVDIRIVGELIVDEADVNHKACCRNIDERVVDGVEVGVEPLNNGSLNF
jgi:hypothetical protein